MSEASRYEFGNDSAMNVGYLSLESIQAMPDGLEPDLVDLGRHRKEGVPEPDSPEWQSIYEGKLAEARDNWRIIREDGRTLEATVVNKDALKNISGVMVRVSRSTITEDRVEAIELAHDAIDNPDMAVIHVVIPGHGGSTGLTRPELAYARKNGLFVNWDTVPGREADQIGSYDPIPSYKSMATMLDGVKGTRGTATHITASDEAAHSAPVLMSVLPDVERLVLTNPTNISEMTAHLPDYLRSNRSDEEVVKYIIRNRPKLAEEMLSARKYDEKSTDPLSITTEQVERAIQILGEDFIDDAQQIREEQPGLSKMRGEERIYMKGLSTGASAVHHIMAGLRQNPDATVTYIFPDYSANYKRRYELVEFIETIYKACNQDDKLRQSPDVKGILTPTDQFWSRYHPLGRLALQREAFAR